MSRLFDTIRIGRLTLPNRIILAPLTRGRTGGAGRRGLLFLSLIALMVSGVTPNTRQSKLRNAVIKS